MGTEETKSNGTKSRSRYFPCGTPGCNCHELARIGQGMASDVQTQIVTQLRAKNYDLVDTAVVLESAAVHILGMLAYNLAKSGGSTPEFLDHLNKSIKEEFVFLGTDGIDALGIKSV